MTFERQFSVTTSLEIAALFCNQNSLSCKLTSKGQAFKTFTCRLYNANGELVAVGNGKGIDLQSKASAIYEAIEHWHTTHSYHQSPTYKFKCRNIPRIDAIKEEPPIEILLREQSDKFIYCRKYLNLSRERELYYPVFLSTPDYCSSPLLGDTMDYSYVDCFSTNSGTATGLTLEEALIHASSELIERDALSLLLLNLFIKKQPGRVLIIDKKTIPSKHFDIVVHLKKISQSEILIVEMTSDLNIPAFLVICTNSKFVIPLLGSGCSLSKEYALERALLEALQSFHLYDAALEREDFRIIKEYEELPKYKACVKFDLYELISRKHYRVGDFKNCIDHKTPSGLNEHLSILRALLVKNGHELFYCQLHTIGSNIHCVHVIIPGLEKFNLVRNGHPVLPSKRGYNYLSKE